MSFIPIIVILAIAVVAFLTKSKKKTEKSAEPDRTIPEDRVYDHLSGRYLTLEEAENQVIDGNQYINRIKSDEEIQKHYSPEQQEIQYIVRDMILSNITETEDDRIYELIEYSRLYDADDYSMHHLWEIKPDHFLGIAYVTYYYPNGEVRDYENQIFGIVQGDMLKAEFSTQADTVFVELNSTQVFKISKKITFREFKRLKDLISG